MAIQNKEFIWKSFMIIRLTVFATFAKLGIKTESSYHEATERDDYSFPVCKEHKEYHLQS